MEASDAPIGFFFLKNSVPEGSIAITHNSTVLTGYIQLLYKVVETFFLPQGTNHIAFTLFIPLLLQTCLQVHKNTLTAAPLLKHDYI